MERSKFVVDLSDNYDKESFKSGLKDVISVITSLMEGTETDKGEIENALSFIKHLVKAANNAPSVDPRSDTNETQQVLDWLFERKQIFNVWIEGLAETMQYIALADSCGYEDEKKDAIFQVAGTREFLQQLKVMVDKIEL